MPIYLMFIRVLLSLEFCSHSKPTSKGRPLYNACKLAHPKTRKQLKRFGMERSLQKVARRPLPEAWSAEQWAVESITWAPASSFGLHQM